jgi:hypothetical protein
MRDFVNHGHCWSFPSYARFVRKCFVTECRASYVVKVLFVFVFCDLRELGARLNPQAPGSNFGDVIRLVDFVVLTFFKWSRVAQAV